MPVKDEFKSPIDFKFAMEYIEKYGNKPYKSLERCETQKERDEIIDIQTKARKANGEVTKMAKVIEAEYGLDSWKKSEWTDGRHNTVREYLWIEMKYNDYKYNLNSLSICVQKSIPESQGREKPRIRFTIDIKENNASQEDYDVLYRFLDKPLKSGLCYIISSDNLCESSIIDEDR